MSHDRVGEDVVSVVLAVLVAVAPARRRRVEQRQSKRMVVGLVPAVLAVVEHRNAVAPVLGRQVSPLLRVDLIGRIGIVSAGHGAHAQVVRRFRVRHAQRELGLQKGIRRGPVHLVHNVDAVVLTSLGQRDVLPEGRFPVRALHTQRCTYRTLFRHADLHVAADRLGIRVERLLQDLPRRPAERLVFGEQRQADRLALLDQFAAGALVLDRANVAVRIERKTVDAVLKRPVLRLQPRGGGPAAASADLVDRIARSGNLRAEKHVQEPVLEAQDLMGNPFAPGVVDRDTVTARRHRGLDEIPNRETRSIVDNDRGTLHVRAQRAGHAAHRSRENTGELLKRQELVVPRKLIRPRNARTRQVVVELVPDDPFPRLREQFARV